MINCSNEPNVLRRFPTGLLCGYLGARLSLIASTVAILNYMQYANEERRLSTVQSSDMAGWTGKVHCGTTPV